MSNPQPPNGEMLKREEFPLFPLNTVLCPGGPLPLRIFEPRYLEMVSQCLRADSGFCVCLITAGTEAGSAATTEAVGTLARIVDWDQLSDGLLGITAIGAQRIRVIQREVAKNQLIIGRVEHIAPEPSLVVPDCHERLVELTRQLVEHTSGLYDHVVKSYDDASWVGYRLTEILPIPLTRKQFLLELEDPLFRLDELAQIVAAISESSA